MARKTKNTHLVKLRERQAQLATELQAAEEALAFDIGRQAIEQGLEVLSPKQIKDALIIGKLAIEVGLPASIATNKLKSYLAEVAKNIT